ncbi:MAG: hypothetical protein K8T26_12225 [Lentisphaerae bacterium]|nr:hypothetical protein [Lentisphaerota bacterium]
MRRRNRKKTVHAFALPVPLAGCVVLAASLALAYVWMVCRCQTLGNELKELEGHRDALLKEYQQELFKWTRLKAPQNLERALRDHGIGMTWPSSRQIVRLRPDDVRGDGWGGAEEQQLARLDRPDRKAD